MAIQALKINKELNLGCDEKKLVRGALLHDYFLYDWHKREKRNIHPKLHGFYHPFIALNNAEKEYELSDKEKDIICKHMWPLTLWKLPLYRESWLVCFTDKFISIKETMKL